MIKNCTPRSAGHGMQQKRTAFVTGMGLVLLWMSPVLATAHPLGIGMEPEQAFAGRSEPGPGLMPPPPMKDCNGPDQAGKPLKFAQAHPMGIGMGPECPFAGKTEPGPGMMPPPKKHCSGPDQAGNPLRSVVNLPQGAQEVTLPMPQVFFSKGLFYMHINDRYKVIPPPPGALIPVLPKGYTTMTIGADTFFTLEGVFYRQATGATKGYEVVPSPIEPMFVPPPPPPKPRPIFAPPEMVSILVHKADSTTSQVVLKRNGRRWIGPQGEEYDRLPSEQQLAAPPLD